MKISEFWSRYDEYTRDLTEHGRKLGFAAAAISWFFKTENFTFPSMILLSLTSVVCFFLADIAQYLTGALVTKHFAREQEINASREQGTIDADIEIPETLDRPVFLLFILKISLLTISFAFLIAEFVRRLF